MGEQPSTKMAEPMAATSSRFDRSSPITPRGANGYVLEVLRPASALYGANGIRIAADGRLWICEGFAKRVSSWDPVTGELRTEIPMEALIAPDDLAFDADGSAYVTDSSRITCRRPDGTIVTLAEGLDSSNGITVDEAGNLYVNEFRVGGRLLEIDRQTGATRVLLEGLDFPNACEKGPDGRLYLQNVVAGTVSAVDVQTGDVELVVTEGLEQVSSVKFDAHGRLYAAQSARGIVTAIDLESGERKTVVRMPHGAIDNIAFDAEGRLYVSSYTTGCVIRVDVSAGAEPEVILQPGLLNVTGMAPLGDSALLVGNTTSLVTVQPDGSFDEWAPWNPFTPEASIRSVWPIDDQTAYMLTNDQRLYRLPRGMLFPDVLAASANLPEGELPSVVAATGVTAITGEDADGSLLVARSGGEVHRLAHDDSRSLVAATGQPELTAVTMSAGLLAAVSAQAGTAVLVRDGAVSVLSGFAGPTGVAIGDGGLFVAEYPARRVTRVDLASEQRTTVAEGLAFGLPMTDAPPFGSASLLAEPNGGILVGCDGDGSIRRIVRT